MATAGDSCISWRPPGVPGVECFRATALRRGYTRHTHDTFAIGVIEEGKGVSHYRGATRYFPARHVIAMNPDEPHTGAAADSRGLTYRMFYMSGEALRSVIALTSDPFFADPCIADEEIGGRLLAAHRALEARDCLAGSTILYEALRTLASRHASVRVCTAPRAEPKAITRAKEFLRAHHDRGVSLSELAVEVGLTSAHLIRAFRHATGVPPHLWLLQLRVERAKDLILSGRPLASVAAELGFADQSHFTRRFRRITGLTPGQYAAGQNRSIR